MKSAPGRRWAVALLVILAGSFGGSAEAAAAASDTGSPAETFEGTQDAPLGAWLSGPFGRVPGLPIALAGDTPDPEFLPLLDAFVRSAPMRLDAGGAEDDLVSWSVTARSLVEPSAPAESLVTGSVPATGDGLIRLAGPDSPGAYRLEADLRDAKGRSSLSAWRLDVPDRPAPEDGMLDVPAPLVIVSTPYSVSSGRPGNGCYVYTCVEIGRTPPAGALPLLEAEADGSLDVHLADGSGIVAWSVLFQPATGGEPLRREESAATPVVGLSLEAPPAGEWLVSLVIVFDRERGWFETLFRLVVQ